MPWTVEVNSNNVDYTVNVTTEIGVSSGFKFQDYFTLSANQTVFVLSHIPVLNTVSMYVNGLLQSPNSFSLFGSTINVLTFIPTDLDTVSFTYEYLV